MQVLIDGMKQQYVKTVVAVVTTISVGGLISVISAQVVTAADLAEVIYSVQKLEEKVDKTNASVELLAVGLIDQRIDYFEDQIRAIEAQGRIRELSPDEAYRLDSYKDDLEHAKEIKGAM